MKGLIERVKDELLYTILITMLTMIETNTQEINDMKADIRRIQDKDILDDKDLKDVLKQIETASEWRKWALRIVLGALILGITNIILAKLGIIKW